MANQEQLNTVLPLQEVIKTSPEALEAPSPHFEDGIEEKLAKLAAFEQDNQTSTLSSIKKAQTAIETMGASPEALAAVAVKIQEKDAQEKEVIAEGQKRIAEIKNTELSMNPDAFSKQKSFLRQTVAAGAFLTTLFGSQTVEAQGNKSENAIPPIYTLDRHDPRIQSYQDSLKYFKFPERLKKYVAGSKKLRYAPMISEEKLDSLEATAGNNVTNGLNSPKVGAIDYQPNDNSDYSTATHSYFKGVQEDKLKEKPIGFAPELENGEKYSPKKKYNYAAVYKEPQPVEYRKEDPVKIEKLETSQPHELPTEAENPPAPLLETPVSADASPFTVEIRTFDPTLKTPNQPKVISFQNDKERQEWIKENASHLQKLGARAEFLDTDTIQGKDSKF